MSVSLTTIDPVLGVEEICALLKISQSQFYELKQRGWFGAQGPALVEVQPQIDRRPRYLGEPFAVWLSNERQARLRRAEMRELVAAVK